MVFNTAYDLIQWIESQKRLTPKVSLERFRKICAIYGSPEKKIKCIHVGGTNGKGSTVAFIKSILRNAGYNVAQYISPYVISFNERISYNDRFISDEELLTIGNEVVAKYEEIDAAGLARPSFFELVTLIAFVYFSRIPNLDFAVLEVGLGGLLDATNVVDPLVSVIASISYDHMNVLGDTLQEIAYNKLGIVKEGRPLVIMKNDEILTQVISRTQATNSPLTLVDKNNIHNVQVSLHGTEFSYQNYQNVQLKLLGFYQPENAALALETIRVLRDFYHYPLTDQNIYQGLSDTNWPGRLQVISEEPIILIDGGHNIDAITRLVEFLKYIKAKYQRPLRIVFAVSHDKAKEKMIPILESAADEIIFSRYDYKRSDAAENLLELSHHPHKRVEEDVEKLLNEAKADHSMMTIFCGSLYFVSEMLRLIKRGCKKIG